MAMSGIRPKEWPGNSGKIRLESETRWQRTREVKSYMAELQVLSESTRLNLLENTVHSGNYEDRNTASEA